MSTKKPRSTPAKRASAKKAASRTPATPKRQNATSEPAGGPAQPEYARTGKGRGVIVPATETDLADLAEAGAAS